MKIKSLAILMGGEEQPVPRGSAPGTPPPVVLKPLGPRGKAQDIDDEQAFRLIQSGVAQPADESARKQYEKMVDEQARGMLGEELEEDESLPSDPEPSVKPGPGNPQRDAPESGVKPAPQQRR
jgi:hypothetical protein